MDIRTTLRPGDRGTRKHVERFGKKLACVRCRYDVVTKRRYTAVELFVSGAAWEPRVVRESGIEDRVVATQRRSI